MEKIVDEKELTECVKGDPVIYVAAVKMLKLPERKKNAWKETSSALGIHIA